MRFTSNYSKIPSPNPNTFAGLMELYEGNYIKIRKLCDNFKVLHEYSLSRVNKGLDLHLQVVERTKYTITLNLTYKFTDQNNNQDEPKEIPNMLIRVYFDAMQAEVLHREVKRQTVTSQIGSSLCNKWRDNRFLFKWLSFCLLQGHAFGPERGRTVYI